MFFEHVVCVLKTVLDFRDLDQEEVISNLTS